MDVLLQTAKKFGSFHNTTIKVDFSVGNTKIVLEMDWNTDRPRNVAPRYWNDDATGGGGGGIDGITVSDNGAPVALPAGITTIDFLGGLVNISDNGNPLGSTVTVEVLAQNTGITTERLNVVFANNQTNLNWDVDQGATLSATGAAQTNITLFDPAVYVYHGSGTRTANGGAGSTTVGPGASTLGSENGTACGRNAQAFGKQPCAFGNTARANNDNCSAFGFNAQAIDADASAFGANSEASAATASAYGTLAVASAQGATALGRNARATAIRATTSGLDSVASGVNSCSYGFQANATGLDASAMGTKCIASAQNAASGGVSSQALNTGASAFGSNAVADDPDSCAFGPSQATGIESCTFGSGARTLNARSCAFGPAAFCDEFADLLSVGYDARCEDALCTSVGANSRAVVEGSSVFGNGAISNSQNGISMGVQSLVDVDCSDCGAIGNSCLIQSLAGAQNGSFLVGHNSRCFSSECCGFGNSLVISSDSNESCAYGRRCTVESESSCAYGKDGLVSTNSSLGCVYGCRATIGDTSASSCAYGAESRIDGNSGKSIALGSGARVVSGASESTIVGWNSQSTAAIGLALGAGAVAQPFSPSAAAPANDDCPFAIRLDPECIQSGATGATTDRLRISINNVIYEINLHRLIPPA